MSIVLSMLLAAAPQKALPPGTPFGKETAISFASNGGLRDWTAGPGNVLYVRDRTERWYQVTTGGPCPFRRALDTLIYTTENGGRLDQFSRLRVARFPQQVCLVKSIRRSTAPGAFTPSPEQALRRP